MQIGHIKQIRGQVVEVEFHGDKPEIHDLLILADDSSAMLEVSTSASPTSFYCYALSELSKLRRGIKVINTQKSIEIPVGTEVLGRVMDLFGKPLDNQGEIRTSRRKSIYTKNIGFEQAVVAKEIIPTGIKAIDFF